MQGVLTFDKNVIHRRLCWSRYIHRLIYMMYPCMFVCMCGARLNQSQLLHRLKKDAKSYFDVVTPSDDRQGFSDFLLGLQVPIDRNNASIIWEFLQNRTAELTHHDFASVFTHALHVNTTGSLDEAMSSELSDAFKALAASICTNELLRKLRAVIHTPSNFAQPLLQRLCRRAPHKLSHALRSDKFFAIAPHRYDSLVVRGLYRCFLRLVAFWRCWMLVQFRTDCRPTERNSVLFARLMQLALSNGKVVAVLLEHRYPAKLVLLAKDTRSNSTFWKLRVFDHPLTPRDSSLDHV